MVTTIDQSSSTLAGRVDALEAVGTGVLEHLTPVAVATTANITLSGEQTLDTDVTTSTSRVLVKDQTDASENGVYVSAAGAWSRATDANTAAKIAQKAVLVEGGATHGGQVWATYFESTDTLDTDDMDWVKQSDASGMQDQIDAITADVAATKYKYVEILQAIGSPDADLVASGSSASSATYVFATTLTTDGTSMRHTCYANGPGTIAIKIATKSGDDFTITQSVDVAVTAGFNVNIIDITYSEGDSVGVYAPTGVLAITAGTDPSAGGYYSAGGANVAVSGSFTDASASNIIFHQRFEPVSVTDTGVSLRAATARILANEQALGTSAASDIEVGRPVGDTLVTGSSAGSSYYVFQEPATVDSIINTFSIYATADGVIELSAWADATLQRVVYLPVTTGLNEFTDVGLVVKQGETLALRRNTAGIAFNTASGGDETPYKSATVPTGPLGGLVSTHRFEFTAVMEEHGVSQRMTAREGRDTLLFNRTDTFHLVWMLGESHVAGRGTQLSYLTVPAGRGYCYRRAAGDMEHLEDPTGNDATAVDSTGKGSMGPAIGRAMLDMSFGAVGAAIVNSGEGGTRIGTNWATAGGSWTQAQADLADAISDMDALDKALTGATILIEIGSNDASSATAKATFKAGVIDLISRARTELGSKVPVVLIPTGPFADGSSASAVADIQAAQHEIAEEEAGVYLATAATEYLAENSWFLDNVHRTQEANDRIGAAVGATAMSVGAGLSVR